MSRETSEWLNTMTRVGFTDKRGTAWHYRQGATNHYPGAVPFGEVERLFKDNVSPDTIERPCPCGCGQVDVDIINTINGHRFGTGREGYTPHDYTDSLLSRVSNIIGDTLQIGTAGLLVRGAQAWVQVEVPENVDTLGGAVRPSIMATTSLDQSIATTYKRVLTVVVCDNTRELALSERGSEYRVRHTRNSIARLDDAREALSLIEQDAAAAESEIKGQVETAVSDKQWAAFLDTFVPLPEPASKDKPGRGYTIAERKREALTELWNNDTRVAPWRNTAWGVAQAVNTFQHHKATVRGVDHRAERNISNAISGRTATVDREAMEALGKVLASA